MGTCNAIGSNGVQRGGGDPAARGSRARPAGSARRRRRLRRAAPTARVRGLSHRLRHSRLGGRSGGRDPGGVREGPRRAAPLRSRQALPAVAPPHRRERGEEPPPLDLASRGAGLARGRRGCLRKHRPVHGGRRPRGRGPRPPAGCDRQAPDGDRVAIVGRYILELSDEEAAAVLGIKPVAVRVRVWRALGKLRRELGEEVA